MDRAEAQKLLDAELARLRGLSYRELAARVMKPRWRVLGVEAGGGGDDRFEVVGASGTRYGLQTQVLWDGRRGDDVRVLVAVDDGGRSFRRPLMADFILASDGTFVDE